ncbi:MAG: hypothetical protein AAFP19_17420 [Bacteroidota bacterium]
MQKYLAIFLVFILAACTPKNNLSGSTDKTDPNDNKGCTTIGTVKDFTGLDGCKFLIVLEDGKKLLPAKTRYPDFVYQDNQKVRFGYTELKDMMSVCMTEDMAIEITCITALKSVGEDIPIKKDCVKSESGTDVEWIAEKATSTKATKIMRYEFLDGFAYHFITDSKRSPVYDCQGNLLCEVETSIRQCSRQVNDPDAGKVIWTNNSIPIKTECVKTEKPMEVRWLAEKIRIHRPNEIIRYDFLDGYAYLYKTDGKRSPVYDCQGNLVCEIETNIKQCSRQVNNPEEGKSIWRKGKPIKKECVETSKPMEIEWMKDKIAAHQAQSVERYIYLDGFAYFFKGQSKRSFLYDCQGTFLCEVEVSLRQCSRKVANPDNGQTIWTADN